MDRIWVTKGSAGFKCSRLSLTDFCTDGRWINAAYRKNRELSVVQGKLYLKLTAQHLVPQPNGVKRFIKSHFSYLIPFHTIHSLIPHEFMSYYKSLEKLARLLVCTNLYATPKHICAHCGSKRHSLRCSRSLQYRLLIMGRFSKIDRLLPTTRGDFADLLKLTKINQLCPQNQ